MKKLGIEFKFVPRLNEKRVRLEQRHSAQIRLGGTDKDLVETYALHMMCDSPEPGYASTFPAIVVHGEKNVLDICGGCHRILGVRKAEFTFIDAYIIPLSVDESIVNELRRRLNVVVGKGLDSEELLAQAAFKVALGSTQEDAAETYGLKKATLGAYCRAMDVRATLIKEGMDSKQVNGLARQHLVSLGKVQRHAARREVADVIAVCETMSFDAKTMLTKSVADAQTDIAVTQLCDAALASNKVKVKAHVRPKAWLRTAPALLQKLDRTIGDPTEWSEAKLRSLDKNNRVELRRDLATTETRIHLLRDKLDY